MTKVIEDPFLGKGFDVRKGLGNEKTNKVEEYTNLDIEGARAIEEIKELAQKLGLQAEEKKLSGSLGIILAIGEKLQAFDSLVRDNETIRQLYNIDELMGRYKLLLNAGGGRDPETIHETVLTFIDSLYYLDPA